MVVFAGAEPFIFLADCDDVPRLVNMGGFGFCSDPVRVMDRAHDLINRFTSAFLLSVIYDDKDAAATLSAENVQFFGITYEKTGY